MYFEQLVPGKTIGFGPIKIEKDSMMEFAKKYANVPIHTDEEYAKTTHFGDIIAPGMLTFLEVWAEYLKKDFFGEQLIAGQSTKVEWLKPVFAGDIIYGEAKITELYDRNPKNGLAVLKIIAYDKDYEDVLKAVIHAVVKKS